MQPSVADSFSAFPKNCGAAEFRERDLGGAWITRKIEPGAMFVTHSKTPCGVRWTSPAGQEMGTRHFSVSVFQEADLTQLFASYLVELRLMRSKENTGQTDSLEGTPPKVTTA